MTPAHPRQIILDTETTGFYHSAAENPDRLIEFAGLEMVNRQLTENTLHLYIHPQRDIPAEAAAIHGITLDQLEGKPKSPNKSSIFSKARSSSSTTPNLTSAFSTPNSPASGCPRLTACAASSTRWKWRATNTRGKKTT